MKKKRLLQKLCLMSKLTFYAFLLNCLILTSIYALDINAQTIQSVSEVEISIDLKNAKIQDVFNIIERRTDFNFSYKIEDLNEDIRFNQYFNGVTVADVLTLVSKDAGLKFKQINDAIHVVKLNKTQKDDRIEIIIQTRNITGKVTSFDEEEGLPGVNVVEKGTNNGTVTNVQGEYSLEVSEGATLVFSSVGYTTEEVKVGNRSVIDLKMTPDIQRLQELVVVGYGSSKKSDLTGSISSILSDDFVAQPLTTIDQALQGRASGVAVTQTSGQPGAGYKIRIRGANSLTQGNSPLYVVDGQFLNNINSININDVESIEVLKDASATAIYGSRGANGVILITTKKGETGAPEVNFESFYGVSKVVQELPVMSAAEFAEGVNHAEGYDVFSQDEINDLRANGGENWQERLFRSAPSVNSQLSVRGGSDNIDYFVSGSYYNADGTIEDSNFKRYTLRSNFNINVSEKIKFGLNSHLGLRENSGVRANLFTGLTWDLTTPAYNENGTLNPNPLKPGVGNGAPNPLLGPSYNLSDNNQTQIILNSYLNFDILDNLTLNVSGGVVNQKDNDASWGSTRLGTGDARIINRNNSNFQNTNRLTYVWDKNPVHRIQVDAVHEQLLRKSTALNSYSEIFASDGNTYNRPQDGEIQSISNNIQESSLQSFLGRVNYSLLDKYLFTATYRADGSSKFPNNKWGYFPSVSFAWRISDESFLQDNSIIDNLKLRLGYGQTGNDAVPFFAAYNLAESGRNVSYPFSGDVFTIGAAASDQASNPNLTWETTEQSNLGMDLGLYNSKITLTVDYYQKKTTDLLLKRQLPAHSGPTEIWINAGELENKGVDITLGFTAIDNEVWNLNSMITFSRNRNEVLKLVDGLETMELGQVYINNAFDVNPTRVEVGKSMSTFRGYVFEGVWQESESDEAALYDRVPGDAKYRDVNNDSQYTTEDITTVGEGAPNFTWGWNLSAGYKNFDLNALFTGAHGNDIYNFTRMRMMGLGPVQYHAVHADYVERWTSENPSDIPATRDPTEELSTQFLENGGFVSLKTISLGYNFNNPVQNIGLDLFRFYVSAENLFIITNYSGFDPESTSTGNSDVDLGIDKNAYPLARTFTVGLKATF